VFVVVGILQNIINVLVAALFIYVGDIVIVWVCWSCAFLYSWSQGLSQSCGSILFVFLMFSPRSLTFTWLQAFFDGERGGAWYTLSLYCFYHLNIKARHLMLLLLSKISLGVEWGWVGGGGVGRVDRGWYLSFYSMVCNSTLVFFWMKGWEKSIFSVHSLWLKYIHVCNVRLFAVVHPYRW
jgi:hypothetical protein